MPNFDGWFKELGSHFMRAVWACIGIIALVFALLINLRPNPNHRALDVFISCVLAALGCVGLVCARYMPKDGE